MRVLMGITDVDDKIIIKAKGSSTTIDEIARKFEAEFINTLRLLNVAQVCMLFNFGRLAYQKDLFAFLNISKISSSLLHNF